MAGKLGLVSDGSGDLESTAGLVRELLDLMRTEELDHTRTFRLLGKVVRGETGAVEFQQAAGEWVVAADRQGEAGVVEPADHLDAVLVDLQIAVVPGDQAGPGRPGRQRERLDDVRIVPEGVLADVVQQARRAGFGSVSLDLIYGSPTETIDDWRESLVTALAYQPDHVSAYSLIVEPGTRLAATFRV